MLQRIGVSKVMDSLPQEVSTRQLECYKINTEFMSQNATRSRKLLLSSFGFSCVSRDPFLVYIVCSLLFNIMSSLLEGRELDLMVFWRREHFFSTFSSFQQGQK